MYHAPIVRAEAASASTRRSIGVLALLLAMMVMVPWLALNAVFGAVVLLTKAIVKAPRALIDMVDYAGGVFVGR